MSAARSAATAFGPVSDLDVTQKLRPVALGDSERVQVGIFEIEQGGAIDVVIRKRWSVVAEPARAKPAAHFSR